MLPHRRGDEGGIDHVAAQGGDAHLPVHGRRGETAAQGVQPLAAGRLGPVLQALPAAAEHRGHRGPAPKGGQEGVVPVEDQQAVFLADVGQQLTLGPEDVLPAAQPLDVGVADVGDDPHLRADDVTQVIDLPKPVHPHLHHADLNAAVQPEQGQGQAHVVVEVPFRLEDLVLHGQDRGDHVLGCGLAHTARHPHEGDPELLLVPEGQVPQGALGVLYLDVEASLLIVLRLPGSEASGGSRLQGGADIGVAAPPPGGGTGNRGGCPGCLYPRC